MRTVASLIRELQKFPPDALCHAYDGIEDVGVTIRDHGFIRCREADPLDDPVPAEVDSPA